MPSAPAKSAGDARCASQDPFIQSTLPHTISTPICFSSAFFLRRTQQAERGKILHAKVRRYFFPNLAVWKSARMKHCFECLNIASQTTNNSWRNSKQSFTKPYDNYTPFPGARSPFLESPGSLPDPRVSLMINVC